MHRKSIIPKKMKTQQGKVYSPLGLEYRKHFTSFNYKWCIYSGVCTSLVVGLLTGFESCNYPVWKTWMLTFLPEKVLYFVNITWEPKSGILPFIMIWHFPFVLLHATLQAPPSSRCMSRTERSKVSVDQTARLP